MPRLCKRNRTESRRGATAVEFVITAPIFFLVLFGALELSRANLIRNSCENAALEGARRGILPGATAQNCRDASETLLDIVRIQDYNVTVDPSTITDQTEQVTVTVQVDLTANASTFELISPWHKEKGSAYNQFKMSCWM